MKQKKKKKIRFKGLIIVFLFIYLIGMAIYLLFTMPNKGIIIKGTSILKESDILNAANIDDDTSLSKILSSNICNKITKLDFVNTCESKINIHRELIITINENRILFFDSLNKELVLSDNTRVKNYDDYLGYPTLINYTPKETLAKLVKGFSEVNSDIISMISEIEYSPDTYDNVVIDDERFLLRMNDGNTVYINIVNIENLNNYQDIYATINDKGVLYLDSNSKTQIFKKYGEVSNEN